MQIVGCDLHTRHQQMLDPKPRVAHISLHLGNVGFVPPNHTNPDRP